MGDRTRVILLVMLLAVGLAGGVAVAKYLDSRSGRPAEARNAPSVPAALQNLSDSFAAVAESAMRSVVHITTKSGQQADPWGASENIGSGVIVSKQGHIITNNHVVQDARSVRVRFVNGREFDAKVEGKDSESDLALLKIDPPGDMTLEPAVFGDSDAVRVGEWVLGIGSPFGYNHTVTHGIVSAKHRRAQLNLPYQDFLQTDAAINPGNSGGALINLRGELVGINAAIVSESRRNEGVGLAISSNLVKWVLDQLMTEKRVRRGYLGVTPMDFNEDLARVLRAEGEGVETLADVLASAGLKEPRGVYIYDIQPDSPAGKAGIARHDVIVGFNGENVGGMQDLFFKVARITPGSVVKLTLLRDKKQKEFSVELAERPPFDPYGRSKKNK